MKRRIVISLGLLLALCLLGNAAALYSLNSSIQRFSELAELQRIQALRASLHLDGMRLERDLLSRLNGVQGSDDALLDSVSHFKDSLRRCTTCHHVPEVERRIGLVGVAFDRWLDFSDVVSAEAADPGGDGLRSMELLSRAVFLTEEMVDETQGSLQARAERVKVIVQRAWVTMCLTLVAVLIAGGFVALHLHQHLTRPLAQLYGLLHEVREGDPKRARPVSGDKEFRDLGHALVQAYGELEDAQKGILEAQKMAAIGQLAAGVAHEVLNPLTGISCLVQTLEGEQRSESDRERLHLIKEHISRITKIVGEFQHFSLPSGGKGLALVGVSALLEQVTELLSYDKRTAGIAIQTDCAKDLPAIRADASRLGVVFTNLILNAAYALREGAINEPKILIRVTRERDCLVLSFADNGPGMSPLDKANAFEPFFTTKPLGSGTGLGLWVCYEAVRGHGGRIELLDRECGGLEVRIELPIDGTVAS